MFTQSQKGKSISVARRELVGPEGLIMSIIAQAVLDAVSKNDGHKEDALDYFSGMEYRNHLTYLGLPDDWLPIAIE